MQGGQNKIQVMHKNTSGKIEKNNWFYQNSAISLPKPPNEEEEEMAMQ